MLIELLLWGAQRAEVEIVENDSGPCHRDFWFVRGPSVRRFFIILPPIPGLHPFIRVFQFLLLPLFMLSWRYLRVSRGRTQCRGFLDFRLL